MESLQWRVQKVEGREMLNNSKLILRGWARKAKISTDKKVDERN